MQRNPRRLSVQKSAITSQAIIDSLEDELVVIDREFRIAGVNAAALERYGDRRSAVVGRLCHEVTHGSREPCCLPNCECPAPIVFLGGQSVKVCHLHYHDSDGSTEERYVDIVASPLKDRRGKIVAMIELARDATGTRRLEAQSLGTSQNLLTLSTIAGLVSESLDLDTILNLALDKVLELMKANVGGVLLLDQDSQTLSYRVSRGLSQAFVTGVAGLRMGEGIAGKVAQSGCPIYVDDIANDPRLTRSVVVEEGLRAFASVPLQSKRKLLGVMNIASHSPRRFRPEDVQVLSSVANLIAVVIENARLYNEMLWRDELRGELLRQIISAQEEERKRIARELHDETSQALTGLGVGVQALLNALPIETSELEAQLGRIQSMATNAYDGIHRVMCELRPRLLDDLGLLAAVNSHVENQVRRAGLTVHLEAVGTERRLAAEIETALFRIIQEATTNVIRHASADSFRITLEFKEKSVAARIEDDGTGFDVDKVMTSRVRGRALGLLGMKERAESLGGQLTIWSRRGAGTCVAAEIPCDDVEAADGQD